MTPRVFIFGAGYSARAFAAARPEPHIAIAGTTRSPEKFAALERAGMEPFLFDSSSDSLLLPSGPRRDPHPWLRDTTHLVVSIAPDDGGDPVLNAARAAIAAMPALQWIGYLSTVGVYGDRGGDWVDETSQCRPVSSRSKLRLAAEQAWLDLGESTGLPVAILRLSGIYGPGRNAFVNLADGTAKRLVKPGQVFNRIHAEDIAGALWHLIGGNLGGVFNVTDDLPAPPQHVVAYAAELMGVEPPPEIPFESAALSPLARSFYGENKRVSNARLKASGYRFRFPCYRSALQAMWTARSWAGEGGAGRRSPMKMS
jgi:nucleoside-diphosphate-sugar epimerase